MPSPRDEDLDWLYGRDPKAAAPEPTRVLPGPDARPAPPPSSPSAGPSRPAPIPAQPAGYHSPPPGRPPFGSPPITPPPAGPPGPTRKKRHPVRTALLVLAGLVLLSLVWLIGVPLFAWSKVERVDDDPAGTRPGNQPGTTFLLVGSDSREGLPKAQRKKLGTGDTAGKRTDTIMIVHVPRTGEPALISVPRDSYLSIPDNGKNKINAAYAFGGPELLVSTLETNTGLRVDGYLEVGFGGFVNVIDAVDGIRMCLPNAIKDRDSHLNLKKGCQTLGGTDALGYVRMRKADPRGDLGRVERQREMLAAIAKKAASPASVLNPVRYWKLCNASTESIDIGQDTSLASMVTVGLAMKKISAGDGLTLTVPVSNPGASTPVGSAVLWDETNAKKMFVDIARGDTSKLKSYTR